MACHADPRGTTRKYSKIGARMTGGARPGSCAAVARPFSPAAPAGVAADAQSRRAIEAAVDRYVAASNRGDAEALMALYEDECLVLPPDHEPIQGRRAIRDVLAPGDRRGTRGEHAASEVDGKIGYLVGRYHLPPTDEEPADSGKYVMCLKRQRDGSWKLAADIWNRSGDEDEDGDTGPAPSIT